MYVNRLILLFAAGTFLFSPVIISWWSHDGGWMGPYVIWSVMIALGWWIARSRDLNDL